MKFRPPLVSSLTAVAAGIAGTAYWLTRPEREYGPAAAAGIACLNYQRDSLKDPYSAKLHSVSAEGDTVRIRYYAKNAYGAFMPGEATCVVQEGRVDEGRTSFTRSVEKTNQMLDSELARFKCMKQQRENGVSGDAAKRYCE